MQRLYGIYISVQSVFKTDRKHIPIKRLHDSPIETFFIYVIEDSMYGTSRYASNK